MLKESIANEKKLSDKFYDKNIELTKLEKKYHKKGIFKSLGRILKKKKHN